MYSLVSASTLGFDLARAEHGRAAAALLLQAMRLSEGDLAVLADARQARGAPALPGSPAGSLEGPLPAVSSLSVPSLSEALRRCSALMRSGRAGEALHTLERAAVVGPAGLDHVVHHDALGWVQDLAGPGRSAGAEVAGLVCEAVSAALAGRLDAPAVTILLAHVPADPPTGELGPCGEGVGDLLGRVAGLDDAGTQRVRRLTDAAPGATGWAEAVHSATRAAHVSGRVREAARAQLAAVDAVACAPFTVTDLAAGAWNLVSGAVQATVVADLLDGATHSRLVDRLGEALSPGPTGPSGDGAALP